MENKFWVDLCIMDSFSLSVLTQEHTETLRSIKKQRTMAA